MVGVTVAIRRQWRRSVCVAQNHIVILVDGVKVQYGSRFAIRFGRCDAVTGLVLEQQQVTAADDRRMIAND